MKSGLLRKLIEKGAIRQGTVFEAHYNAYGLSCVDNNKIIGDFILIKAKAKEGEIILDGMGEGDILRSVPAVNVTKIDGMEIERMAEIYNFDEDGNDVTITKKRRGRKPKQKVQDEFDEEETE